MASHNIFFISDTHFGHAKSLTFFKSDGSKLRDFAHVDEMDEYMIRKWNETIRPQDKVYHLGDVLLDKKKFYLLGRLNGHKRLVRGNHDIHPTSMYLEYFEEIHGCRVFAGMPSKMRIAATHVPIHPQAGSRWTLNVHGHLHSNTIPDKRYFNVSVENINYTPVSMDELIDYCLKNNLDKSALSSYGGCD